MGILANRSILQLLLSSAVFLCCINAQQVFLEQQLDQLPAPDLGGNDVLPEMFLTTFKKTGEILNTRNEIPPDTLIDPDGRVVAFSRRFEEKYAEELQEERELLERIAKKYRKELVLWDTYLWTVLGCVCIVACGIVPAFILPHDFTNFLQSKYGRQSLHLLLSFAVGSLIGDVFLHLLPAVWADNQVDRLTAGVWTTVGVLFCFMLEKLCATSESSQRRMCAILNLIANFMDNFTHGLAIGGSFLMDTKLGLLTTFSIVIHELPHEISDFAILLRADFNRWSAVKAQLLTAAGGALGACAALFFHIECTTNGASQNILPFTAGSFINIALAQILPELMKETDSRQNILQWMCFLVGIMLMGVLNQFHLD
ncbi:metal cation transporter, ZIP family [Onchocerca flexuosa]|uniref:Metal cation transporter, ZIP family n=2 Tax=Onchocerca flexuosa TaxID=387005 RepID=A0A238BZS2_9BILA|nr:metal cation transporter, ZIP family [Onchocerca flexuosa]